MKTCYNINREEQNTINYKDIKIIFEIKQSIVKILRITLISTVIVLLFFGSLEQSFAEFSEEYYEDMYHNFEYSESVNNNLQPDNLNRYSDIVVGVSEYDEIRDLQSINDQEYDYSHANTLNELIESSQSNKALELAKDVVKSISDGAKLIMNDIASSDLIQNLNNGNPANTNNAMPQYPPMIIGDGNGGGGNGGNGNGSGGNGSGGNGSGNGSGVTPNIPDPIKCKNMTDQAIQQRLNTINASSQYASDISMIYEKSMLLFCLGDYKKAGLEIAKMNQINSQATQNLLNNTDNALVLDRFSKVLNSYNSSPINPKILDMANKVKQEIEKKNKFTDDYMNELNSGYQYNTTKPLNFEEEVDKIYKIYRSQDMLEKDLASIYGSEAAIEIINSRNTTTNSGKIPEYK